MRATDVDIAGVHETLPDPADLPALASADPAAALTAALAWLAVADDQATRARAHQAAGIVTRDRGDAGEAARHLDAALAAAERAGDRPLIVDVRATRGATLALAGRTAEGLAELDRALRGATGGDRAGVLVRRAFVLSAIGEPSAALTELGRALTVSRRADDRLWQAKVLNLRCLVLAGVGLAHRAEEDAIAAEGLFDRLGQTWMSVQAQHNRAFCAGLRGDLVTALREYDAVDRRYRELGIDEPMLAVDRIAALLSAGLAENSAALAAETLGSDHNGPARDRGQLLVAAATAELALGHTAQTEQLAKDASREFRAAKRPAWTGRAALLAARARFARGDRSARLLRAATTLVDDPSLFADDQLAARLLTARIVASRGNANGARVMFDDLGRRIHGPALARATQWLARALSADLAGDETRVRRACARGLDAVDEHRAVFGAVEVRAAASVHGAEFADLGARALLRHGTARQLLTWVERSRASALADPAPLQAVDTELSRRLALAREAAASNASAPASARAAEHAVAALRRTSANHAGTSGTTRELTLEDLGDRTLVALLVVDGRVHTIVGRSGRLRRRTRSAPLVEVRKEADFLRFALRRASAGIGLTSPERLFAAGARLEQVLFGDEFSLPGSDRVVVVPPAALHDLPWAALPALRTKELVVAPSLTMWSRAQAARRRDRRGTVLAVGPGLESGGAELASIAALHPAATLLGSGESTADNLLHAMDGARLVHLAAHGSLRADNPMFSALQVDGGPLFVHDIERLRRAPREVVLASCNSGLGASVGSDQLLGLATALLRAGTSAVLTSTVAVSDAASVPFSVDVHRALARGASLPAAARRARHNAFDDKDPLATATALAFSVWGS